MKNFFTPLKWVLALALVGGCVQTSSAQSNDFDGHYEFSSELTIENQSYRSLLKNSFEFEIESTLYGVTISDFIIPSISAEYDDVTGELTLKTNYGTLGRYNIGFADAEGTWTGMGTMKGTLLKWQIGDDGSISIPDFTLVDYSNYSKNQTVTVIARYSNCAVTPTEASEDDEPKTDNSENFEGRYQFSVTQTEYVYEPDSNGSMQLANTIVTNNYILEFEINEYNQIWRFEDYTFDSMYLNTLRNRGNVSGKRFTLNVDTNNGVEWVYVLSDESTGSTDAKLFGSSNTRNWVQGQTAFTLTKNTNETFTLTSFSLWQRTMELVKGEGQVNGEDVMNQTRVFRPIKLWSNIKFMNQLSGIEEIESRENAAPRYFNLQGIETPKPVSGHVYIKVEGSKASKVLVK